MITYKGAPVCLLSTRDPPQNKGTHRLKGKGWIKRFHANGKEKNPGVATLVSEKIVFKTKAICKRQSRTLSNDKGSNLTRGYCPYEHYVPNRGAPKHVTQILMDVQGETDSNRATVGDLMPQWHRWTDLPDRKSTRRRRP